MVVPDHGPAPAEKLIKIYFLTQMYALAYLSQMAAVVIYKKNPPPVTLALMLCRTGYSLFTFYPGCIGEDITIISFGFKVDET